MSEEEKQKKPVKQSSKVSKKSKKLVNNTKSEDLASIESSVV